MMGTCFCGKSVELTDAGSAMELCDWHYMDQRPNDPVARLSNRVRQALQLSEGNNEWTIGSMVLVLNKGLEELKEGDERD